MNYTTAVSKPSAHITKKKSRLKVYNGHVVFMEDNDNFEFEIHNPTQNTILCKIKLHGNYISQSGLVLRPGERVFLERFFDTNNKFQFSTYTVNNTLENQSAITLNGDIRIEFYNENKNNYLTLGINNNYGTSNLDLFNTTNNPNFFRTTTTTDNPIFGTCGNSTLTAGISSTALNTASNINGVIDMNGITNTVSFNSSSTPISKSIETGRVEKGEKTNQHFQNSNKEFEYFVSHQIVYKIQPLSTKNKTTSDIRNYCTECGTKTKSNFKFCPSCGNDLTKPKETKIKYTDEVTIKVDDRYLVMSEFKITLDKLIEKNEGKTIVIHKPSLSEEFIRAIIY
jgi:hypothetical protein